MSDVLHLVEVNGCEIEQTRNKDGLVLFKKKYNNIWHVRKRLKKNNLRCRVEEVGQIIATL